MNFPLSVAICLLTIQLFNWASSSLLSLRAAKLLSLSSFTPNFAPLDLWFDEKKLKRAPVRWSLSEPNGIFSGPAARTSAWRLPGPKRRCLPASKFSSVQLYSARQLRQIAEQSAANIAIISYNYHHHHVMTKTCTLFERNSNAIAAFTPCRLLLLLLMLLHFLSSKSSASGKLKLRAKLKPKNNFLFTQFKVCL